MVKISVSFEPEDYAWVVERAAQLYGRRGQAMYLRHLVKRDQVLSKAPVGAEEGVP